MANYPSTPVPEYPLEEDLAQPEVLITVHKDGSEQRRLKGTGKLRGFKLRYGNSCPLTFTEVSLITAHYAGEYGNLNAFNFTHPERTGETYLCRYDGKPKDTLTGINCYTLEVQLQVVTA